MSQRKSLTDNYSSYGNYNKSRELKKEYCNLIQDIESGKINVGSITPGNCSKDTEVLGNVTIKSCKESFNVKNDSNSGILKVTGGIGLQGFKWPI